RLRATSPARGDRRASRGSGPCTSRPRETAAGACPAWARIPVGRAVGLPWPPADRHQSPAHTRRHARRRPLDSSIPDLRVCTDRQDVVMFLRKAVAGRDSGGALFYRGGKSVELAPPGRYVHWWWEHCHVEPVDLREVSQTVEGQEILTADKIGVRVTLIAQFRVTDPVLARHT